MNMTISKWRLFMLALSAAGEGGSGNGGDGVAPPAAAAGGDGAGAPASGVAGDAPVSTALAGAFRAAGDTPPPGGDDKPGDKPADGDGAGDDKPGDGDGDDGQPEPFALAAPEGMEGFATEYTAYSTAANDFLTANPGASARDALTWAAEHQAAQVREAGKAMRTQFQATVKGWEDEAKADPVIGGANYDASIKDAVRGITAFGTPALMDLLDDSGLAGHKEVVAVFAKVGKLAQESPILGGEGGKGNVSFSNALYGKKG